VESFGQYLLVYQEVNALTVSEEPENNGDLAATSRENALDTLQHFKSLVQGKVRLQLLSKVNETEKGLRLTRYQQNCASRQSWWIARAQRDRAWDDSTRQTGGLRISSNLPASNLQSTLSSQKRLAFRVSSRIG
jgi:hypothetical protein